MLNKEFQLEFLKIIKDKIGGVLDDEFSKPILNHLGKSGENAWWVFFRESTLYLRTRYNKHVNELQKIDIANPNFLDIINEFVKIIEKDYNEQ